MKPFLLIILVVLCTSCATTTTFKGSPVVHFHDGSKLHVTLLMMTDTMLVVDVLCQSWSKHGTKNTMGLCAIPAATIRYVHLPGRQRYGQYALIGAAFGAALGAVAGAEGYEKPKRKPGALFAPIDIGRSGSAMVGALIFGAMAGGIGLIVGAADSRSEQSLDPRDPRHQLLLRDEIGFVYMPRNSDHSWTYKLPESGSQK